MSRRATTIAGRASPRPRRCALYARKSSEEGLEQGFNSLDAQREACAAYVKSQKAEGWRALPVTYDDGGFSGGSMERPALKRLMADIAAGEVDVVVVYKIDRLTRSLADFAAWSSCSRSTRSASSRSPRASTPPRAWAG